MFLLTGHNRPPAKSAISSIFVAVNEMGTSSNPVLNVAGAIEGDIAIVTVVKDGGASAPSGFSLLETVNVGNSGTFHRVFWKKLTSSDISSPPSFSLGAGTIATICTIYRNGDQVNLINSDSLASGSNSPTASGGDKSTNSKTVTLSVSDIDGQSSLTAPSNWSVRFIKTIQGGRAIGFLDIQSSDYVDQTDIPITLSGGGNSFPSGLILMDIS